MKVLTKLYFCTAVDALIYGKNSTDLENYLLEYKIVDNKMDSKLLKDTITYCIGFLVRIKNKKTENYEYCKGFYKPLAKRVYKWDYSYKKTSNRRINH